ncbi:hypothetical protein B0T20DRAFT_455716 [Sordaria brevicollis]|uniref:PX domain-containing protein n=1 Tax=Sordaria brevicollis TaxID=83679 RepID=A0AAE0P9Q8_SORBR|nr:hypothetical protein B0T20DRAFT_455716 [Sordaria brevicollis]
MLVPLMLSLDLEEGSTSKTSSRSQPETETTKLMPQLHTSKNHNSYNGIRTLPIATRVQCDEGKRGKRKSHKRTRSTRTANQDDDYPLYEVTLYYPHNRTCTIYRSREDFSLLRTGLHSRSSSAAPQSLSTAPPDDKTEADGDLKEVARWDTLLRKALERFAKRGHGRHSIEWFLRRRLGDCERMASGNGMGLPAGTMRRVRIKPRKMESETRTADGNSKNREDEKLRGTGSTDEDIVAKEGRCLHVTSEEEEDNTAEQNLTDNESVTNDESAEDEEAHSENDNNPSNQEEAEAKPPDNPTASPKPTRPKEKQFTEVLFSLDSLPIEPFKPIPSDLGKLAGSSLAKRRKQTQQKVEVTELADQNTANNNTEEVRQRNIEDAEDIPSDPDFDVGGTLTSSSSEDTILFTPTSSSIVGEDMSPGNPSHPNSALTYMLMFSRRVSGSDSDSDELGQGEGEEGEEGKGGGVTSVGSWKLED